MIPGLQGPAQGHARSGQSGFTLIEVVVAMLLLAVMSVMAYQGLEQVLAANSRSLDRMQSEAALQRTWQIITQDIIHLRARSIRDSRGGLEPAYFTRNDEFLVSFSRGGGPMLPYNPSGMQRITYGIDKQDRLIRLAAPATALPEEEVLYQQVLLEGVKEVRFLQLNSSNDFEPNWPPLNEDLSPEYLPRMVQVHILMQDGTETHREIPGVETGG